MTYRVVLKALLVLVFQLSEELRLGLSDLELPGHQADLDSVLPLLGDLLVHLGLGRGVLADGSVALKEQGVRNIRISLSAVPMTEKWLNSGSLHHIDLQDRSGRVRSSLVSTSHLSSPSCTCPPCCRPSHRSGCSDLTASCTAPRPPRRGASCSRPRGCRRYRLCARRRSAPWPLRRSRGNVSQMGEVQAAVNGCRHGCKNLQWEIIRGQIL